MTGVISATRARAASLVEGCAAAIQRVGDWLKRDVPQPEPEVPQAVASKASDVYLAALEALARAIDAKDQTEQTHIRRVQLYAAGLARAMGLSEPEIMGVETAALLHDIGKLAVPEHILSKPGPLTEEEFQKIRQHPQIGAEIIRAVPFPYPVAPLILSHHERWDGSGYPQGLKGDEIPLGARILTAVDYYDAATSERPYHKALSHESAASLMHHEAGRALDPAVVKRFVQLLPSLIAQERLLEPARTVKQDPSAPAGTGGRPENDLKTVFEDIALAHRELHALYDIAQTLGTSLGVADTMALISEKVTNIVPWSACALFLYEPETSTLKCRFAAGVDAPRLLDLALTSGDLGKWVARSRHTIINGDPRGTFQAAGIDAAIDLHSEIVCPLFYNDTFIGSLALYHVDADRYTNDHRRLLERIAEQAGAVIHNSIVFEQTQEDSLTDPLTGLANRRSMFVHLTRELARAARMGGELALIVMDLDHFKTINDTYGHHTGDRALREMATALQATLRPYDLCVRYAGDEFIVVLGDCSREAAEAKRRELQQQVGAIRLEVGSGRSLTLAASAGAAVFPEDGTSYEALLAEADRAMYRDKADRRSGSSSTTTARIGRIEERRRHPRVAGPFDGRRIGALETSALIYDLSEGGCFIIAFHDQDIGRQFTLKIDLPHEGWIVVSAETVYNRPGFGFAVRFTEVSDEARARIARLVDRLRAPALQGT
jgi:diguanylate cyclase (GGDEF)-like protein/putative nucleotidyltransferase with HDIG domain